MSVDSLLTEAASRFSPWKLSCRLCATENIVLVGEQEIDGVQGSENNRIVLTAQDEAKENGPWIMKRAEWVRPVDYAAAVPNALGVNFLVTEGDDNKGEWRMTSPTTGEITPDLVATTWTKVGGFGSAAAVPNPWTTTGQEIEDTAAFSILGATGAYVGAATGPAQLEAANVAGDAQVSAGRDVIIAAGRNVIIGEFKQLTVAVDMVDATSTAIANAYHTVGEAVETIELPPAIAGIEMAFFRVAGGGSAFFATDGSDVLDCDASEDELTSGNRRVTLKCVVNGTWHLW